MKTIDDNEIIETSRGRKRIGALFDENAMLRAENERLREVIQSLLDTSIGDDDISPFELAANRLKARNAARAALAGGGK